MDAPKVEFAVQLSEKLSSVARGFFWPASIADAVGADNQYLRSRPLLEHSWQGAHEHVKSAIRLEVAGAIGQDLVRPRKAGPAAQPETRGRIRVHERRIDPLVHNFDL